VHAARFIAFGGVARPRERDRTLQDRVRESRYGRALCRSSSRTTKMDSCRDPRAEHSSALCALSPKRPSSPPWPRTSSGSPVPPKSVPNCSQSARDR
jgi:hypothetical protein